MNQNKAEIRPLNGLRGVAALSVAMGHYKIGNLVPAFANLSWWNDAAVDLFFCLSGFAMCLAYRTGEADRLELRNYLVARVARIYPLYLLSLILSSFIVYQRAIVSEHQHRLIVWDYVRQMTLINSWSIIGSGMYANPPAWSVSVEFFCYLFVFPVLFYISRLMLRQNWSLRLILTTALVAGSCYLFVNYFFWGVFLYGVVPPGGTLEIAYSVNLLRGVLGFAAGWAAYGSFLARDRLWAWASRWADAITLAVLALLATGALGLLPVQLMILGFPLLILGVSSGRSLTGRFLSWNPVHYMGTISYSIYLLHLPWANFCKLRIGLFASHSAESLSYSVILVGGMIVVAALSYHTVEMPLRRIIRAAWQTRDEKMNRPIRRGSKAVGWAVLAVAVLLVGVGAWRVGVFYAVPPFRVALGEEIARYPTFERVADEGWGAREDWGVWSVGRESTIVTAFAEPAPTHLKLFIKGSFYLNDRHPALTARIAVNGVEIGMFTPSAANRTIEASLPLPAASLPHPDGLLRIKLWIDSPASPKSLGLSEDTRALGFGLQSLKLEAE